MDADYVGSPCRTFVKSIDSHLWPVLRHRPLAEIEFRYRSKEPLKYLIIVPRTFIVLYTVSPPETVVASVECYDLALFRHTRPRYALVAISPK